MNSGHSRRIGWPASNCRGGWRLSLRCRAIPPARCLSLSYGPGLAQRTVQLGDNRRLANAFSLGKRNPPAEFVIIQFAPVANASKSTPGELPGQEILALGHCSLHPLQVVEWHARCGMMGVVLHDR